MPERIRRKARYCNSCGKRAHPDETHCGECSTPLVPSKPRTVLWCACAVCGKEWPGFGWEKEWYCWDHLPESAAEWKAERTAAREASMARIAARLARGANNNEGEK